jgi:chromosome segregation protein
VREAEGRRREVGEAEQDRARLKDAIAAADAARQEAENEAEPVRQRVRALARELEELEPLALSRRRARADRERAGRAAEEEVSRRARDLDALREEMAVEGIEPEQFGRGADDPYGQEGGDVAETGATGQIVMAIAGETVTVADPAVLRERVRALRARIRSFGPVNAQAESDYRENRERHDFLTAQMADLKAAEEGLHEAMEELRRLVRERFRESFERIGADFEQNFQTFFGGGTARLVLTEPEDYGESGVEIIARPPGKRLQSLSLLSGGERSMTAVALLFALLQSNPAPFCVLDEVDAALDESNVGRFGDALRDLAERTQFIVITHNRVTIQAAGTVYGVSMGRDSASSVLSLRLGEIEEREG